MANTFTQKVSAGSRVYFFDARTDKNGHPYMVITEQSVNNRIRSCIYVHPEDFDKFTSALTNTINHIENGKEN